MPFAASSWTRAPPGTQCPHLGAGPAPITLHEIACPVRQLTGAETHRKVQEKATWPFLPLVPDLAGMQRRLQCRTLTSRWRREPRQARVGARRGLGGDPGIPSFGLTQSLRSACRGQGCFLLSLVGRDRCVAICHPLRHWVMAAPTGWPSLGSPGDWSWVSALTNSPRLPAFACFSCQDGGHVPMMTV